MELNELVNRMSLSNDRTSECEVLKEKKYQKKKWKARIDKKVGSDKTACSGKHLYENMEKDHDKKQGFLGPPVAYVVKQDYKIWATMESKQCGPEKFPVQAHDLIPKGFLPNHMICAYLGVGYKKEKKYTLHEDAPYSCDHANNGYCMPYATPLKDWKAASGKKDKEQKRLEVANNLMKKTQRQLHQGSHRAEAYEQDDVDEESGLHKNVPGYLNHVEILLNLVHREAWQHPSQCEKCKPAEGNKIPPRKAVVRHMDQVSGVVKMLLDTNEIFVSEYASQYLKRQRVTKVRDPEKLPDWFKSK